MQPKQEQEEEEEEEEVEEYGDGEEMPEEQVENGYSDSDVDGMMTLIEIMIGHSEWVFFLQHWLMYKWLESEDSDSYSRFKDSITSLPARYLT